MDVVQFVKNNPMREWKYKGIQEGKGLIHFASPTEDDEITTCSLPTASSPGYGWLGEPKAFVQQFELVNF